MGLIGLIVSETTDTFGDLLLTSFYNYVTHMERLYHITFLCFKYCNKRICKLLVRCVFQIVH